MKKWIFKGKRIVELLLQHAWMIPQKVRSKLHILGIALGVVNEMLADHTETHDKKEDESETVKHPEPEEDGEV